MSINSLESYLNENFPDLLLESPLFYNAQIGIRFELGIPYRGIDEPNYFSDLLRRAKLIYQEIFYEKSNMLVVVKGFRSIEPYSGFNEGENVFPKYIKNKEACKQIEYSEGEKNYEENGNLSGVNYYYVLPCKGFDIDYKGILEAKSHMDFAIEPFISDAVFFINLDKHIIFYMYDDRGLDVVSKNKEGLYCIYEKYNDWILNYDRAKIDRIFEG